MALSLGLHAFPCVLSCPHWQLSAGWVIVRRPSMVPSPANLCFLSGPLSRKNRIPRLTGTLPLTPMAFCADSLSSFSSSPLACSFPSNQISPISLFCDDLGLTPSLRRSLYFWNNVKGSRGKSQCLSPSGITSPRASCMYREPGIKTHIQNISAEPAPRLHLYT